MRTLEFDRYGGAEVLYLADRPEPRPGPGEVTVRVQAASINPVDWKRRQGLMAGGVPLSAPGHLGVDAAGVVTQLGEGVIHATVGDEVFGLGTATQAQAAVLHAWARKPPTVDWSVAAAIGLGAETSERALRLLGAAAGTTLFIDGGAGGVGSAAVQIARAQGVAVFASGSDANADYLRDLGATPVRSGAGVAHRVRAAAGTQGVDAVFDVVGKTPIEDLTGLVVDPAQVVSIANPAAQAAGARITRSTDGRPAVAMLQAARLLHAGELTMPVRTFALDRAKEAYRLSEAGHVRGKLVLLP